MAKRVPGNPAGFLHKLLHKAEKKDAPSEAVEGISCADSSIDLTALQDQAYRAASELIAAARMEKDDLLVVGCSTSEVHGTKIGSGSMPNLAEPIYDGISQACREAGIFLAAQCCEHLNRALIMEKEAAKARGYAIVNAVPFPKAGGSFATYAYQHMIRPVAVEHIQAEAGMDIGDTLIGMHLKDVAVPVRLSVKSIGQAHLTAARTRPKYIGGQRANYDPELG